MMSLATGEVFNVDDYLTISRNYEPYDKKLKSVKNIINPNGWIE